MGSDASIYSQIQQPKPGPSPLEQYAQIQQIKGLTDQGELHALQRRKAESDLDEFAGVKRVMADPSLTDPEARARAIDGVSPKFGMEYRKGLGEDAVRKSTIGKNEADTRRADIDTELKQVEHGSSILQLAKDNPAAWPTVRAVMAQQFPKLAAQLPEQYDPDFVSAKIEAGRTLVQQMVDRRAKEGHQITLRGQDLTAETAARGQDMTDSRTRSEGAANRGVTLRGQDLGGRTYDADRGVIVNTRTGEATPATADGQPLGQKPIKPTEAYLKNQTGVANVRSAIDEYKKALDGFKLTDLANPDARARMGTSYNNMMLQAKEAYNLGVLNGPDYMILQQVVTNPLTLKGGITSNAAMKDQATHLDEIMAKISKTSAEVHGQTPPASATPPVKPPVMGETQDGYTFLGGNPADPKRWKKKQ